MEHAEQLVKLSNERSRLKIFLSKYFTQLNIDPEVQSNIVKDIITANIDRALETLNNTIKKV